MNIDNIIARTCDKLKIGYCYATFLNQKVQLSGNRKFPIMIRTFGEDIKETDTNDVYTSTLLLFFADIVYSDAINIIAPVVRKQQTVAFEFVKELRRCGIACTVGKTRTAVGDFDSKVAGVSMELTVEYDLNCNG